MGLYRAVIRYLGPKAIFAVLSGVTCSVVLLSVILLGVAAPRDSGFGALPIYWAFALIYVGGSRFIVRGLLNFRWSNGTQRVVIYGAGAAGVQLATGLVRSGRYHPIAFIDDNASLQGSTINGLEVFSRRMRCRIWFATKALRLCCSPCRRRRAAAARKS